ncbi:phage tail-collar fiber domain-containing protein [Aeromonas jandaei]|uniref:phage tail-collar fiber domain-containing protein n=1 Tax=Aeromonas jandaei TaxID=650 RepID=UPI0012EBD572|nr:phage tail protein [Aeromonas jandaei]MVG15875.1 hypothetical protein [Aeromonas jandaei]
MSQVITNAFETYWQGCLTDQVPVVLDEVVLADIPNLDITAPIDPNTGLPPQAQIVHRHPVDQRGRINNNAVAYSIVMDTTVGNFSFNAMYLINKASGMVGMIVYKGRETKTKTDQTTGTTGNSLVKSMLMEYDQAATATVTTVEAGTWQIDYSARLLGMDEQLRLQAIAIFGSSAFFGDGFKLINKAGSYKVQPGVAIVGGLRIQLDAEQAVTVGAKPVGVWVDVHHAGTILSRWDNHFEFKTSTTELTDYTDSNGYRHYVTKLATVEASNGVLDARIVIDQDSVLEKIKDIGNDIYSLQNLRATESIFGMLKIATKEQTELGVADDVAITPKKLRLGFSLTLTATTFCFVAPSWLGGWKMQAGYGVVDATTANQIANILYPTSFSEDVKATLLTHSGNGIASAGNQRGYIMSCERGTLSGFQSSYSASKNTSITYAWLAVGK